MVDPIEIYCLYDDPFDDAARIEVYEQLYDLEGLSSSRSPAEIEAHLAEVPEGEVVQNLRYRSVHLAITFRDRTPGVPDLPGLVFNVEDIEFDHSSLSSAESQQRIEDLIDFVARCYDRSRAVGHTPLYLFGASPTHVAKLRQDSDFLRTTTDGVRAGDLEELYWLQLLPPRMVDRVGRDRLTSAPAHRVETLADGAVLLVAHEDPIQFGND